jgi:lactate dehydrogenase-like 2-hydroxyacid dehydrogenase
MTTKPRLLVARRVPPAVARRALREFDTILVEADMDAAGVIRATREHGTQAVFSGPKVRLTRADIAALPDSLRIIANPSAGTDHMDVAAANDRGLIVTNTPGVLTDCTADLAFLLILAACRRAADYSAIMRQGWRKPFGMPDLLGMRPSGRTLGIVGMGRIGQAVARRARGFDMRVLYHNRSPLAPEQAAGAEYVDSFEKLLPLCDIVSLHLPGGGAGTPMTRDAFALMRRGSVFVNTARGSLVDEDALIEAMQSGHLFAAGLDVYRSEPDFDRRLAELPNVFLTPHVASATVQTRDAMGFLALDNIAAVLAGKPAINPV